MRLALALILLALVLIVLAVAAAWIARRAEPLDYSADEIADGDWPHVPLDWLGNMAAVIDAPLHSTPIAEEGPDNHGSR